LIAVHLAEVAASYATNDGSATYYNTLFGGGIDPIAVCFSGSADLSRD